jgi:hypothetical protein
MLRTLLGYAILAVVGYIALKLVFALLGLAFSLLMTLLWLAAIGFVIYLVLKVISPDLARRVRETISGARRVA